MTPNDGVRIVSGAGVGSDGQMKTFFTWVTLPEDDEDEDEEDTDES